MKHRHSFFVDSSQNPPVGSFELVEGKDGDQAVLKIRQLEAAREWKITIDANELDEKV